MDGDAAKFCPKVRIICPNKTLVSGDIVQTELKLATSESNPMIEQYAGLVQNAAQNYICTVPACDSSPCLNGGICTETVTGFACVCTAEFFGPTCNCSTLHTADVGETRQYTFPGWKVPENLTLLDFEVSANQNAHIGLSSINEETPSMYEINGQPGVILSGRPTFDRYWVTFRDGTLKLGRYGDDTALLDVVDPGTSEINYVGVWTGFGSDGDWKFHSFCGM
ncbi:uncharacterized protein [Diadema setosum]|uniref:uncharacterized protein n=1 Tax=Diadema setosum TaxID=31175 RepID=UPI003B3AB8E6